MQEPSSDQTIAPAAPHQPISDPRPVVKCTNPGCRLHNKSQFMTKNGQCRACRTRLPLPPGVTIVVSEPAQSADQPHTHRRRAKRGDPKLLENFGRNLMNFRRAAGLSTIQLIQLLLQAGEILLLDRLEGFENLSRVPSVNEIYQLCKILRVTPVELVTAGPRQRTPQQLQLVEKAEPLLEQIGKDFTRLQILMHTIQYEMVGQEKPAGPLQWLWDLELVLPQAAGGELAEMSFGAMFRAHRCKAGFNINSLSDYTIFPISLITAVERNQRIARLDLVGDLAAALEVGPGELMSSPQQQIIAMLLWLAENASPEQLGKVTALLDQPATLNL